jgi:hypothetical protein
MAAFAQASGTNPSFIILLLLYYFIKRLVHSWGKTTPASSGFTRAKNQFQTLQAQA